MKKHTLACFLANIYELDYDSIGLTQIFAEERPQDYNCSVWIPRGDTQAQHGKCICEEE